MLNFVHVCIFSTKFDGIVHTCGSVRPTGANGAANIPFEIISRNIFKNRAKFYKKVRKVHFSCRKSFRAK